MAEKKGGKDRKRKHFEMEKLRQSPFQRPNVSGATPGVVSKAPRGINAAEYAESRAVEIHNMMEALSAAPEVSGAHKRLFQALPRHMRRRAASHNSKRMPVRLRLREAAKTEEKQQEPKKKKSRRHCRKPSNLLAEYSRRQRNHVWLETHIWHAKRFKMVEQWGYKIPLHPNDKSVRASYRAMANGCLLQDISYYQCVEVCGRQDMITTAMRHLTSPDVGLTTAAKEYLDGAHEGHTVLYKYDHYPNHAIGPVMFLWQYHLRGDDEDMDNSSASMKTKLWVWSHPACSDEVLKEITHACSLEGPTEHVDSKPWLSKEVVENVKSDDTDFKVTILPEQLVRLRLTGPKSHALLLATFELCDWGSEMDKAGSRWWEEYSRGEERRKMLEKQNQSWEQMKGVASPGVLKAGSVFALVVKDPRLGLPVRKSSVDMASEDLYKDVTSAEQTSTVPPVTSAVVSPLWDAVSRRKVKASKMPEKDLNNLRSKQPVPGCKLDLGKDTARIPLMLIQQPGSRGNYQTGSVNFGSGFDVIIPAGWSMAFWIAFVYRGARVGGARESETCSREQGVPHFPRDFPDTKAGREYSEDQKKTGEEKYKRYPPAKRPNYAKFAVTCPFAPDWATFVREWDAEVVKLEIDMSKVVAPDGKFTNSQSEKTQDGVCEGTLQDNGVHGGDSDDHKAMSIEACNVDGSATGGDVTVQGSTDGDCEGTDKDAGTTYPQFNVIRSLCTRKRLQTITASLRQTRIKKSTGNKITNEETFGFLTQTISFYSHSLICLNLRPLLKGSPQDNALLFIPTTQDLSDLKKDKKFGGPVEPINKGNLTPSSTVIGQSSRKAIGWVTSAQYSFARGQGSAVGFCTFPGFCELMLRTSREKCGPVVLVRNTNTVQYRFANIIVV